MKKKDKPGFNYSKYAGIGLQMAIYIVVFVGIGIFIDSKRPPESRPWFTIGFALLGIVFTLYYMIKKFGNIR